jgi:hypothetical protein
MNSESEILRGACLEPLDFARNLRLRRMAQDDINQSDTCRCGVRKSNNEMHERLDSPDTIVLQLEPSSNRILKR